MACIFGTFIAHGGNMGPIMKALPWEITMKDGTVHIGLPLRKGGNAESYLGLDGKEFSLAKPGIASHRELQTSLMPAGLLEQMTPAEIRDLLAKR